MRSRKIFIIALAILIATTLVGCYISRGQKSQDVVAEEILISAATSLREALIEIESEYKKKNKTTITFNFGASGTLQRQIIGGAPCDLFISASKENMDTLEETGLIVPSSRKTLVGNTLTLIASKEKSESVTGIESLSGVEVGSISMGIPETVPSGKYAKESLENQGVWNQIQEKLVFGKDAKQVLDYVDTGNVDCGFVYQTDAMTLKTGRIICNMPQSSYSPILYQVALVKDSKQPVAATAFLEFLLTDFSINIFEKYGFVMLTE